TGGTVDLSATAQILDPNAGDQRYRAINITADGAGSTVKLNALTSFADFFTGGGPNDQNRPATLTAQNHGSVVLGATNTLLTGVAATIQTAGTLTGNLQLAGSTLQGSGTLTGNLTNGGTVQPGSSTAAGVLAVTGSYTQLAAGALEINIGGLTVG